eukprot:Nk52_evm3s2554 gene=Nk52_evmTU3s2554
MAVEPSEGEQGKDEEICPRTREAFQFPKDLPEGYLEEVDRERKTEFGRLKDVVYVDHAGATLYAESQIRQYADELCQGVFANPHSMGSSSHSQDEIDCARDMILRFVGVSQRTHSVVFTAGCTAGLKLLAESFPWECSSRRKSKFYHHIVNHTSVLGMRQIAVDNGADVVCVIDDLCKGFHWLNGQHINSTVFNRISRANEGPKHLFVYPAMCNFSGEKFELSWCNEIADMRAAGCGNVFTCLDASAFLCSAELDLSTVQADFVTLSLYKIFGFPTGMGALVVKNSSASILRKRYFGGGSVSGVCADTFFCVGRERFHSRFEDGTMSFLDAVALKNGFKFLNRFNPDERRLHAHSIFVTTVNYLKMLRYSNGQRFVDIYSRKLLQGSVEQGPIVNFNIRRRDGSCFGYSEVEKLAVANNIHLRTGCFCNAGACQIHLRLSSSSIKENLASGHVCWDDKDIIDGKPVGSIRVSYGTVSTLEDARKVCQFLVEHFFQVEEDAVGENQFHGSSSGDNELPDECAPVVSAINIFPLKSCGAFTVSEWPVSGSGFLYDRHWLVTSDAGECLTQKRVPRMCLIKPVIDVGHNELILKAPGYSNIHIPLDNVDLKEFQMTVVCGDNVPCLVYPDSVNSWISAVLGRRACLATRCRDAIDASQRRMKPHESLEKLSNVSGSKLSFANESQFLLTCEESLDDVNSKIERKFREKDDACTAIKKRIPMSRFRANIVLKGSGKAYIEDSWKRISVGDNFIFDMKKPCVRCQMICVDQQTGERVAEPLRTLSRYRRLKSGKIVFGRHMSIMHSREALPEELASETSLLETKRWNSRVVRVGMTVKVLE